MVPEQIPDKPRRIKYGDVVYLDEEIFRTAIRKWKRRVLTAFLVVTVAAGLGIYFGVDAGNDSDQGLRNEGERATFTSCIDRAELRFTMAVGFDKLRRLAIGVNITDRKLSSEQKAQIKAFLDSTQGAIDPILSDAVNRTVVTSGEINDKVLDPLRKQVLQQCIRSASRFNGDTGILGINVGD